MTTKIQPTFTRTKTAVAVGAALFVVAGASIAAYEPRTPVAGVDDAATSNGTDAVTIDVLANDGAVDSSTLTIATQPAGGTAEVVGSAIVFTPNASFSGSDTFTYQVTETDWRTTGSGTVSLASIDAVTPIATSYVPIGGGAAVPIVNGGDLSVNSVDLTAAGQGSWNDTNSAGVVGRSWAINQTVTPVSGCNVDDTTAPALSLSMVWSGERQSADADPGGNQFTITSAAAPTPDVLIADIATSGIMLKVHKSVADALPSGEPDNISQNGSAVATTGGTPSFGSADWNFNATANWAGLTPAEFEAMNVTVLASMFNNKQWYNNGATFDATVDLTQCSLNTSTMTVTITDDSSGGGDGGGSSGGGGGGAFSGVTLFVLSLLGLGALGRRRKQ